MSLPGWTPLALGACLYIWQAGEYALRKEWPMAGVFIGYSLSNVMFVVDFIHNRQ